LTSELLVARADDERAPRLRDAAGGFEFEPHHCFACGELNEHGLHLVLHTSPDGAWTELVLDRRFQGWEAVAHGGIVCTILDEVMAWAVIGRGTWGVTARMAVTFRGPVLTGTAIRAEGWVVEQRRRAVRAEGRVIDPATGTVLATGESTFVALPQDQLEHLKARYGMRRISTPAGAAFAEEGRGNAARAGAAR
jgi:acyl-coenzyme A thioesterase PaaI-like protein